MDAFVDLTEAIGKYPFLAQGSAGRTVLFRYARNIYLPVTSGEFTKPPHRHSVDGQTRHVITLKRSSVYDNVKSRSVISRRMLRIS